MSVMRVVAPDDDDIRFLAAAGRQGIVNFGDLIVRGSWRRSGRLRGAAGVSARFGVATAGFAICDEQAMMPPIADRARQAAIVVLSFSMKSSQGSRSG